MTAIIQAQAVWEEPRNREKIARAARRPKKYTAGGYIHDLIGLGKAITLCKKCQPKFKNFVKYGYTMYKEVTGYDHCISQCQDCNEFFTECNTFLKTLRV